MRPDALVTEFGQPPSGRVLGPGDPGYDDSRSVWNATVNEHPAAVVQCASPADVVFAVNAARSADLPVSVKGGGHNIAGSAVRDGAVLLDLSGMRNTAVDPERRTASVGGGAVLSDLDHATQSFGLAVPAGVVSDTGIGGLTLGGGFGWLSRRHGLTVDNLISAEVVLADGQQVRASERENPDLFWALRGGGGNFGVVTEFEFRLHPVGPDILFGPVFHRLENAADALGHWAEFMRTAPREAASWADLASAPPAPFLPDEVHGEKVLILMLFWSGDPDEGEAALAPLKTFEGSLGNAVTRRPYVEAQSFLDETYARGARNYWTCRNHTSLGSDLIGELVDLGRTLPTTESDILICAHGGAIDDVPSDATAYPHRRVPFMTTPGVRWRDPSSDEDMVAWIRRAASRLEPFSQPGAYVNFVTERNGRESEAYGANHARLAAAKAHYDPSNLFRINQNIAPSAG